ncbi:hypothetical protein CSB11_02330 [Candidatus Campbellbacteria bacterium]|nr:MAG: hypothetical protein CSB11_02330 [Candidatus Campbellbacteria bacterium]
MIMLKNKSQEKYETTLSPYFSDLFFNLNQNQGEDNNNNNNDNNQNEEDQTGEVNVTEHTSNSSSSGSSRRKKERREKEEKEELEDKIEKENQEKIEELKKLLEELKEKLEEKLEQEKTEEKEQEEDEKTEDEIKLNSTCIPLSSKLNLLKKGSKDKTSTKQLQKYLNKKGYNAGYPDGIFGNKTKKALQDFQKDNNLTSDGKFGKQTARYIDKNCGEVNTKEDIEEEKEELEQEEIEETQTSNETDNDLSINSDVTEQESVLSPIHRKLIEEKIEKLKKSNEGVNNYIEKQKQLTEAAYSGNTFEDIATTPAYILFSIGGFMYYATENTLNSADIFLTDLQLALEGEEEKEFFFQIYNNSANKERTNNKPVYILIHGYRSSPKAWAKDMARSIERKYGKGKNQILLLNWDDVVDHLNIKANSRNIQNVAEELKKNLTDWNINKKNTTIISHSLGTLLSAELSQKLGKVKKIVALDPAGLFEYEINYKGDKFTDFANKAEKTLCISTRGSDLSNETLLNSCDQSYLIKSQYLKIPTLSKHSLTYNVFDQIINKNTLYNNSIFPNIPPTHIEITDEDEEGNQISINGYLNVENLTSKKLKYLELKNKKDGKEKNIYLGTEIDNNFKCEEKTCQFYGWLGDDEYKIDDDTTNYVIKDFRKHYSGDKIMIDKGFKEIKSVEYNNEIGVVVNYGGWFLESEEKEIYLDGVSVGEVKEWVKNSLNKDGLIDKEDYKKLPIQIE